MDFRFSIVVLIANRKSQIANPLDFTDFMDFRLLPISYCLSKILPVFVGDVKIFVVQFCVGTRPFYSCLGDLVGTVFTDYA